MKDSKAQAKGPSLRHTNQTIPLKLTHPIVLLLAQKPTPYPKWVKD